MIMDRLLRRVRRMPSCEEVAKVLQAYLDGEVDVHTARMVAGHLEDCATCSHESDVYNGIKASLATRRRDIDPEIRRALEGFIRDLPAAPD
jgi:anti-sigma factor (TIGR02949 family)